MTKSRALTAETLGAWLIKGSRDATAVEELIRTDFSTVSSRCVRRTYRVDLVRSGQPVLFWLSGDDSTYPAGIYAQGITTGPATQRVDDDVEHAARGSGPLVIPVELEPVDPPILRSELLARPALSRIEVITMAAGSNPSFVTRDQLAELREAWPQLTIDDTRLTACSCCMAALPPDLGSATSC